ncbi:unnamed protein product, partial [Allacma fusca]
YGPYGCQCSETHGSR